MSGAGESKVALAGSPHLCDAEKPYDVMTLL
jgi:hypothetical protein